MRGCWLEADGSQYVNPVNNAAIRGNVFGQPDVLAKIAGNPQTASFLADPGFVAKIDEVTNRGSSRRGSYEYGIYQSCC